VLSREVLERIARERAAHEDQGHGGGKLTRGWAIASLASTPQGDHHTLGVNRLAPRVERLKPPGSPVHPVEKVDHPAG
jgi:hypothetical protein